VTPPSFNYRPAYVHTPNVAKEISAFQERLAADMKDLAITNNVHVTHPSSTGLGS